MLLNDNIKKRRAELRLTLEEVAKIVGVSRQTIQRYENGVIENIPSTRVEKLAKALRTTAGYLMTGETNTVNISNLSNYVPIEKKRIPLVGTIAAGQPILAEEHIEEYLPVNDNLHADFALKIQGDSMVNAGIYDGDIVFIQQMDDVEDGQIAAVLIDDSATLKRVYKMDGMIRLVPENPKYQPMIFSPTNCDTCKILGKAVAVLSRL